MKKLSIKDKILNIINNPLIIGGVGVGFFAIAMVNSLIVNASSLADLSWWGVYPTYGLGIILAFFAIRYFILPIGKWIIGLVKMIKWFYH